MLMSKNCFNNTSGLGMWYMKHDVVTIISTNVKIERIYVKIFCGYN